VAFFDRFRRKSAPEPSTPAPATPRDLFMDQVLDIAQRHRLIDDPNPDRAELTITGRFHGQEHKFFLENLFHELRELPPEERPERIITFIGAVPEGDDELVTWDEARDRVAAVVRPAGYWSGLEFGREAGPVVRPFTPFFAEAVVLDSDHSMRFVTRSQMETWGATAEQLFAAGRANIAAVADRGVERYDEGPAIVWHVASDDSYESSRLLVPGWLAGFADKVEGTPIAAIPHRSMLLVAGAGNQRAIERILATTEAEFKASSRRLSPALYTVGEGDSIIPLILPRDHPLRTSVALAHARLAIAEYEEQKALIEKQHEIDGTDIFVAGYLVKNIEGNVVSLAVWGENVDSLLPVADAVAFGREGAPTIIVRWSDVQRIAGSCWERDPVLNPPRMRTVRWPEPAILAELERAAVDLRDAGN
jgi:hypothetical protein